MKEKREIIAYVFFGALTTLVNYIVYLFMAIFFEKSVIPTVIAWVVAVIFAYITNRLWVFKSDAKSKKAVFLEITSFFLARAFSGVIDIAVMWAFVDKIGFNDTIFKLISNVFVIVFNYVAGKWFVFQKEEEKA